MTTLLHWDLFAYTAGVSGDRSAVIDSRRHSYGELFDRACRLAEQSPFGGLKPGHRVLIDDSGDSAVVVALLAAWKRGAIATVVPTWFSSTTRAHVSGLINPHMIWNPRHPELSGVPITAPAGASSDAALAMLFITSGTTGVPKVVAHSTKSMLAGLWATILVQQESLGISWPSIDTLDPVTMAGRLAHANLGLTYLTCMPFSTMAGFTMLQRSLLTGESLVMVHTPTARDFLARVESHGVNSLGLTPFIAQKLVKQQTLDPVDVSSVITVGIGGNAATDSIVRAVETTFDCITIVGYGCTETAGPVIMSRPSDPIGLRAATIGRPLPHTTCRVVRNSEMMPMGSDQGAELEVSCTSMMLGYLVDDGKIGSARVLSDGWYRTGDLATISADGYVRVVGRISDLIIRAGQNIDPVEIERIIDDHKSVERSAVIGTPSRVLGEEDIRAFVTLRDGEAFDSRELTKWCRERLALNMVPRSFTLLGELPVASDGGLQRTTLRRLFESQSR